ncbi:copper chaperone PCu(A)C [Paracoccus shanxieyensis]|uniref:DUF1775 domain-containing protein n=1 Tax=Paracoccus shanxieyensis TaxID=2675752 RepID=A0A6L6IWR6_9RHOB|nr:copper chaperone PCu(A)C [Paracoccus shanxieyensis]MTH64329.1 DUF1775 domain-containing protein [Paracoccus shanxieyensis]MTH87678.1 DUF1775 domain-containing protein [Paracoccus shanxieyensis]
MTSKLFFGAVLGATLTMTLPALAHVTLELPEAAAGSTYKAVLRIGHGCGDKATKAVRVQIPDGFYNAKPMPKPGWELQTITGDYARPFDNHGEQMTSGVREIVWSGGDLPDEWYDEFTLRGTVGPELVAGSTLYFPTVQECDGARESWIDVTGADDVSNPAPSLQITEAVAGPGHHHGGHAMPGAVTLGQIGISGQFTRATPPGAKIAGGFMVLKNDGSSDDRLVSVSTPVAARAEIHEMSMDGDVMKMRALPDGLPLPAGQVVELKPGGYHLMLMGLTQPLVEGETVPLTLHFEQAGDVDMTLPVGPINARGDQDGDAHANH